MPWMIPPSTCDEAPSGLITRPTSWIAAIRSTRTSPVSTSTATSATCTPNVSTCIPVGFGPRAPLPRICPSSRTPTTSSSGQEPPSEQTTWPSFRESVRSSLSWRCAAISITCRAVSAAAARTAGPIDGIVDEPAEIDAYGPRDVSPAEISTRSIGSPSSSAAICCIAVFEPVPMSCIAVTTCARPSAPSLIHAYEGGPPPPYQICDAMPTPRFHVRSLHRLHLVAALPVLLRALVALHQVLRRVRPPSVACA